MLAADRTAQSAPNVGKTGCEGFPSARDETGLQLMGSGSSC